jgi:integrase
MGGITIELSDTEVLKAAYSAGIIDMEYVREEIEMTKRKELLNKHPYKIWEGTNGKWYTYLPDEKKGRVQRERNTQTEIEKIVIDYWEEQSLNPTLKEVFNEWNDRRLKLEKISKGTHLRYIEDFDRYYSDFGKKKIRSLAPEDIEEFLEEQIPKHNLTAKGFSNLKTITRGMLKRAKKRKLITFNVEELFEELDVSDTDFKKVIKEDCEEVFDEQDTDKIMNYLLNNLDSHNLGIILMFVTGIRVGELVALKYSDFQDANSFNIRRTETRFTDEDGKYIYKVKEYPKSDAGVRTVVIPNEYSWVVRKIRSMNPFGEYLFLDRKGRDRANTAMIRKRLYLVCEKVGIKKRSPHKIRKTYGTILLDCNIDQRFITGQMGHSNILCTERHYHRNRRSIDQKIDIVSNVPEFMGRKSS